MERCNLSCNNSFRYYRVSGDRFQRILKYTCAGAHKERRYIHTGISSLSCNDRYRCLETEIIRNNPVRNPCSHTVPNWKDVPSDFHLSQGKGQDLCRYSCHSIHDTCYFPLYFQVLQVSLISSFRR